jgi:hypothetical protein
MPTYIARIELRGSPTRQDYDNLHARMQDIGFLQTITIDGETYELPHAEYAHVDRRVFTSELIREEIQKVVNPIYSDYLVLVCRTDDLAGWLIPVTKKMKLGSK